MSIRSITSYQEKNFSYLAHFFEDGLTRLAMPNDKVCLNSTTTEKDITAHRITEVMYGRNLARDHEQNLYFAYKREESKKMLFDLGKYEVNSGKVQPQILA